MAEISKSRIIWVAVLTGLLAGAGSGAILKFLIGGDHAVVAAGVAGGFVGVVVTNMTAKRRDAEASSGEAEG